MNHPILAPWRFALRSFLPPTRSTTVLRPPNISRTESHRHASRPVVPPSRAARRRLTVRIGLDRRMLTNAPAIAFAARPSRGEIPRRA